MRAPSRIGTSENIERPVAGAVHLLLSSAQAVVTRLVAWQQLAGERRALRQLDQRMLRDIGLRREDAIREASRPFWDDGRIDWWLRR